MSAISSVDTALWDIKAKSLNVPLCQLLGGASRDAVLVYGHASGADIEDTVTAVAHYLKLGYKAIRAQSGIPGLESTYGVGRGQMQYEPPEKGVPPENRWSSAKYLNFVPQLFTRLRKEFGPDVHLLRDAHHRLTPISTGDAIIPRTLSGLSVSS
jgi:mannonate dehydratase